MNLLFWFLSAQVLITIAWLFCACLTFKTNQSEKLRLHYSVLIVLFSILLGQLFVPIQTHFQPLPKLWIESSEKVQGMALRKAPIETPTRELSNHSHHFSIPSNSNTILFLLLLIGIAFWKMGRDLNLLTQIKKDSFVIKKIGHVEILAHDKITIPLTFWTPNHASIVIPTTMLSDSSNFRMSVLHELQHQRQHDTMWMFILEIFKVFGFLNPITKIWIRRITDLQEFACDETLVDRSKVNSRQYARCLLQVAESTLQPEFAPACATGLLFRMERYQLKRRIKMLLSTHKNQMRIRSKLWPKLVVFTLLLGGAAYATKAIAQAQSDRTITLDDANAMAKNLSGTEGIPVAINDAVVKELNRYLDTPLSRQGFKEALDRMKTTYQPSVDATLTQYQLPKALDAIPLIESRYQNLKERGTMHTAGLWQFIPPTARRMGIPVHEGRDDRLNVEKLTDAAGRLLKADALFYDNLGLSILAFNWGEQKVNHMLGQTLSRDPWVLVHANGDDNYLPKVIAGMLIIANPKSVE